MEKILKKANELENALIKGIEANGKIFAENKVINAEAKEIKSKNIDKARDLKIREEKIKPIEDADAYMEKAIQLMKDANKKLKVAGKEQDIADEKKRDNLQDYNAQKKRIAIEDARILDEKEGITKGYKQLADAEAKSENKMLKSVVGKITKK